MKMFIDKKVYTLRLKHLVLPFYVLLTFGFNLVWPSNSTKKNRKPKKIELTVNLQVLRG